MVLVLAGVNDVGLDTMRPADEVSGIYPYFRPFWHRLAGYSETREHDAESWSAQDERARWRTRTSRSISRRLVA